MIEFIQAVAERPLAVTLALVKRRSWRWPELSAQHKERNPFCACCGGKKRLTVHHIFPVHLYPERELDEDNLITLCEHNKCHLNIGHSGDWKAYNPRVVVDAALLMLRRVSRLYERQ